MGSAATQAYNSLIKLSEFLASGQADFGFDALPW